MFGMQMASDNMQKLAENRVRDLMSKISNKNYLSILVGIALTAILQSSGAVTSLLVNLGRARMVTLSQVMGIIIGTAVGSTLTVQLISFNVTQWGFGVFATSFALYFMTSKRKPKSFFAVVMGFGMVFWGLEVMGAGTAVFKNNELLVSAFQSMGETPIVAFLVTALFSGFVHSSAVVIGLAMTLTANDVITFYDAIYWVYGANVGTTATALMVAIGGNVVGRRVAWAHFFYKFGSVLLFIGFTGVFAKLMEGVSSNPERGIANAHAVFNLICALVFYPFIPFGVKAIRKVIVPGRNEKKFKVKYLKKSIEEPLIVLAQARREALRMGDIVLNMVEDSIDLFRRQDEDLDKSIKERDNQVDLLHREIKFRLVDLSTYGERGSDIVELIDFTTDLESAADVVDRGIRRLARKIHNIKQEFSAEGWKEIEDLHGGVVQLIKLSLAAYELKETGLSEKVIAQKRDLRKMEKKLRESHINRLNKGMRESMNTSEIHLDVLAEYRRISGLLTNHAYHQLDAGD